MCIGNPYGASLFRIQNTRGACGAMASRILKLAVVAALVATAAGSTSADSNATSLDVNITLDGEVVPFARCFITAASLRNQGDMKQVRLNVQLVASSTVKRIDIGLFNAAGYQLSDAEMPDKTNLVEVRRVLDVSLKRLSDDERIPKGLVSLVDQSGVLSRPDAAVYAQQTTGGGGSSSLRCVVFAVLLRFIVHVCRSDPLPPSSDYFNH